jgi:hypothetical protein
MSRNQIIILNAWVYGLLLSAFLISKTDIYFLFWPVRVLLGGFVVFWLSGANILHLMQQILRRDFSWLIFFILSTLNSLFIPPLFVLLFYYQFKFVSVTSVTMIYASLSLIPLLWPGVHLFVSRWIKDFKPKPFVFPSFKFNNNALLWAFIIVVLVQSLNVFQYSFLPVPDSYSWLILFESKVALNKLPITTGDSRNSFAALVTALHYLADVKLFILFKYFLPFLSLFALAPLYLAARTIKSKLLQLPLLLSLLISPTISLELGYIRQQVLFLIFLYFAVGLSIYAYQKKDYTTQYLILFYAFLGTFIHPAFLIFVLTWLIAFFISKAKWIWSHKYLSLLVFVLAIPVAEKFTVLNMFVRIYAQARASLRHLLHAKWNLRFPAHFINSDTYEMSWPGFTGVTKYYAYYVGPVSLVIIIFVIILLIANTQFRKSTKALLLNSYTAAITLPIILFFCIAEIAPRFGNIAFLPDRAWQYLGILLTLFLFLLLSSIDKGIIFSGKTNRYIAVIGLGSFYLVSIIGAMYINSLTKYIMPDYEFRAIEWIKENTSSESRIFSGSSRNIIGYHAKAKYTGFNSKYYSNPDKDVILRHMSSQIDIPTVAYSDLNRISAIFSELAAVSTKSKVELEEAIEYNEVSTKLFNDLRDARFAVQKDISELSTLIDKSQEFQVAQQLGADNLPDIYVYYAKTHPKNPYAARPYESSFTSDQKVSSFPALDGHPDDFIRVYEEGDNVIIWQVLDPNI